MKITLQLVSLATAVVALATSVMGLRQTYRNSAELEVQRAEIAGLQKVTSEVALSLTIDSPKDGAVFSGQAYIDMRGTYVGQLPPGYRLWVFARDQNNFYLVYPPTLVTRTMKTWSQTNVKLEAPGRWELHVCVGDERASSALDARAGSNDRSGFASLPSGLETVRYVVVERR